MSDQSRPMAVIDFTQAGHQIRFVIAHWPARFSDKQILAQERIAYALQSHVHNVLFDANKTHPRHVVLVGDFNSDPYQTLHTHMDATKSRRRALKRQHPADTVAERVRLYNCGWRLLGENVTHPLPAGSVSVPGSYYWEKEDTWHTLDQVLVSGSLLSDDLPRLDESSVAIYVNDKMVDDDGIPVSFEWDGDTSKGYSDHLPLAGKIDLRVETNV